MENDIRHFIVIHPVIIPTDELSETCLAVFNYIIKEKADGKIKIDQGCDVLILPSEREMRVHNLGIFNYLLPETDSLFLSREEPLYIPNKDELAVLRNSLVSRIKELLTPSSSYQP